MSEYGHLDFSKLDAQRSTEGADKLIAKQRIDLLDSLPWMLDDEDIAIAEDKFDIYASESGMTLDSSEDELEQAKEEWLLEANAKAFEASL